MIFISLISIVHAFTSKRSGHGELTQITEVIKNGEYSANVNSSIIFQYTNYYGTFNESLIRFENGSEVPVYKNLTLYPELTQGCQPFDRKIIQKQLFNTSVLQDNETLDDTTQGIVTSVYAANYYIFVIRSDFKLFAYKIEYNEEEISSVVLNQVINFYDTFESTTEGVTIENSQLQCSKYLKTLATITCFILSDYGTLLFQYSQESHKLITLSKVQEFRNQKIVDSFFDDANQRVLVTYQLGVDIYKMAPDGSLTLTQTLQPHNQVNLLQAQVDEEGERIYVLDEHTGLYIYNMNKTTQYVEEDSMFIYLKGGQSFDFVQTTFFIVAQTEDGFPYVLEVFLDHYLKKYYFNGIYQFDQDIYDVYVGQSFVLFVKNELHTVIFHSVYNGFLNDTEEFHFNDLDLVQVDELLPPWPNKVYDVSGIEEGLFRNTRLEYKQTFLVGVSERELSVFTLKHIAPWILCNAMEQKKELYQLTLLSSDCINKKNNDKNSMHQMYDCKVTANFTFEGLPVYFFDNDSTLFICLGIGAILITIILGITVLLCRKKLYQSLNDYEEKSVREYGIKQREDVYLDSQNIQTVF